MRIPPALRAAALAGREALARVADQTGTAVFSAGGFTVTIYNPRAAHIAPATSPETPPHACADPRRCLACRATGRSSA